MQRGSAQLPDLHVTDSSEAMLSGRKPPFRLLVRAIATDGRPIRIRHAVSEGFVVRLVPLNAPACCILACTVSWHICMPARRSWGGGAKTAACSAWPWQAESIRAYLGCMLSPLLPTLVLGCHSELLPPPVSHLARCDQLSSMWPTHASDLQVATRRTRTAGKVEIPNVDDHVSKLEHMGKETVKKLQDLRGAALQVGLEIAVPENCINKGQSGCSLYTL